MVPSHYDVPGFRGGWGGGATGTIIVSLNLAGSALISSGKTAKRVDLYSAMEIQDNSNMYTAIAE